MVKRVAVITDATSAGYFFPHWHRYYGGQFGHESLHVVTYRDFGASFESLPLGGLITEDGTYDDDRRAQAISGYVARLLETNDVVLRCDVDEFLVPAPRRAASLRDYIETLTSPYVTAIGFDIVEAAHETPLDLAIPLLPQRPWCVETSSLSKTAVVTREAGPIRWAPGFHAATVAPRFDDLYLLHMKFADVKGRVDWFCAMRDKLVPGSSTYAYYDDGKKKLESFAAHLNSFRRVEDADALHDTTFRDRFVSTVIRNPINGIWQGSFEVDRRRIRHGVEGL